MGPKKDKSQKKDSKINKDGLSRPKIIVEVSLEVKDLIIKIFNYFLKDNYKIKMEN